MAIDRTKFFDSIKESVFTNGMTQDNVDGVNALLDAWDKDYAADQYDSCLAYCLATAYHETAHTMQPIAEIGHGRGRAYGVPDQTGDAPYGRGFCQLTWRANYVKADRELGLGGQLSNNYDLALQPDIAAKILFKGMFAGWFTGKKLSNYFDANNEDPINARRIINGLDSAQLIARHYTGFNNALNQSDA